MKNNKTRILIECALMVALSTLLSLISVFRMPFGGSVTLCSMAPLIVISFRHGAKWGVLTGAVYGLIQMILGMENVMYCTTVLAMAGCILLDYILAFAVMGFACIFGNCISKRHAGIIVGCAATGVLRFLCSFLSGILIWGGYAPEDQPVWLYSLIYNGTFMLPEIILTAIAAALIMKIVDEQFPVTN